jgi:hypothetical protein
VSKEVAMTRPGSRRGEHVQTARPAGAESAAGPASSPSGAAAPRARMAWYWRLVLFLWTTSFIFLLIYELLSALFRMF